MIELVATKPIRGDFDASSRLRPPHVVAGPDEPCGHVVECAAAAAERSDAAHLRPLLRRLELGAPERRITKDVRALVWW